MFCTEYISVLRLVLIIKDGRFVGCELSCTAQAQTPLRIITVQGSEGSNFLSVTCKTAFSRAVMLGLFIKLLR